MKAFRITATCLYDCGVLAEGLSTDPPTTVRPRKASWTRWDEINELAEEHPHATNVHAEPEVTS